MNKTLKEIYNWDYVENPSTSLLKRVNAILGKTPDELTGDDVCVLIRQEMFLDIAIPKAIEMIKEDHSVGDNYDYCMLINLSKIEASLSDYKEQLSELIGILRADLNKTEFEFEEDKNECFEAISRLEAKLK